MIAAFYCGHVVGDAISFRAEILNVHLVCVDGGEGTRGGRAGREAPVDEPTLP